MNSATQKRLIAISALVTFGIGSVASISKNQGLPDIKFIVGFGTAFTIVSIMADLGWSGGAAFAVLIMLSTVLATSDAIFKLLGQYLEPQATNIKQVGKRYKKVYAKRVSKGNFPVPKIRRSP